MSVIVFLGLKGGAGTTGAAMRALQQHGAQGAVDLDLVHGDLAPRLGVCGSTSIADLAALAAGDVTTEHLDAVSYPVPGGAVVVPSPATPELAEIVTPAHVERVLDMLAARGSVVVDAGSRIDVAVLAACRRATRIVLVARADAACARQCGVVRDLLARAGAGALVEASLPGVPRRRAERWASDVSVAVATAGRVEARRRARTLVPALGALVRREAHAIDG